MINSMFHAEALGNLHRPGPGKFSMLTRHFLKRLSNFELVATNADSRNTVVQILVLLSLPGQFLPFWFFFPPADMLPGFQQNPGRIILGFEYYFICFSMIITGLVAVLNWNALFPDQKDCAALSPLPIHARIIFLAKLASLLIFQLCFTLIMNVTCTFLFPYFALVRTAGHESIVWWILVHAFSILAGNLLIVLCLLSFQGLLLLCSSARLLPRISLLAQFALFVLLLAGLLLIPDMENHLAAYCRGTSRWLQFLPSTWVLGIYESLMGRTHSPVASLAVWGWWAIAGIALAAAMLYYISYRRHLRNAAASNPEPYWTSWALPSKVWNVFSRRLFREQQERGIFEFVWKTLCRSRLHQLYFFGYLGAGLAFLIQQVVSLWAAEGWQGFVNSASTLRAIPLGIGFFVLVGLRMIYALPAELPANWIFQMAAGSESSRGIMVARKAMICQVLLPLHLLFFFFTVIFQGWGTAFLQGALNLAIALFLMEWLLGSFDRIPFTAAYQPGKARIHLMWPVYWAGFCFYSFVMAAWEGYIITRPAAFLVFGALLLTSIAWLRRKSGLSGHISRPLIFDDVPNPTLQLLNLEY